MKRPFWNIDYCPGPHIRVWWLGFFWIAKWLCMPWHRGWMFGWNND